MLLAKIYPIAERIRDTLAPYCDRIEIAGSIRRACVECGDIDIVLIPKPGQEAALRTRAKTNAQTIIQDGPLQLIMRLQTGLQLDLYFAHAGQRDLLETTPSNWGSVLLCRTGSKEHNIWLCARAEKLGLHWDPPRGITHPPGSKILACSTEEDIYDYLGIGHIPPTFREERYLSQVSVPSVP